MAGESIEGDREVPIGARRAEHQFANRAPNQGSQRVLVKLGQFLSGQRDIQHNFDLCHAQALTLMQSTIPKHATSV